MGDEWAGVGSWKRIFRKRWHELKGNIRLQVGKKKERVKEKDWGTERQLPREKEEERGMRMRVYILRALSSNWYRWRFISKLLTVRSEAKGCLSTKRQKCLQNKKGQAKTLSDRNFSRWSQWLLHVVSLQFFFRRTLILTILAEQPIHWPILGIRFTLRSERYLRFPCFPDVENTFWWLHWAW